MICRVLLVVTGLGVGGVALEFILMAFGFNMNTGYVMNAPGVPQTKRDLEFTMHITLNEDGFRDRSWPAEKSDAAERMAVVGDSFVFGFGVEAEERFTNLLETFHNDEPRSRRIEVLNVGRPGWDAKTELKALAALGPRLRPDVVLLSFNVMDDFPWDDVPGAPRGMGPMPSYPPRVLILASRILLGMPPVVRVMDYLGRTGPHPFFYSNLDRMWARHAGGSGSGLREMERKVLRTLADLADRSGSRAALALVPGRVQCDPFLFDHVVGKLGRIPADYDPRLANDSLADEARKAGIPVLDLLPECQAEYRRGRLGKLYYALDAHWTAAGHRWAAELIHRFLHESGLLDHG